MSQSGTESPQPSKGHTPDGSNGASQLGQGMSGCTCECCEGEETTWLDQVVNASLGLPQQMSSGTGYVQLWLSKGLWQGHIDWFNTCELFKSAAALISTQPVGPFDAVYIDGVKLSRTQGKD